MSQIDLTATAADLGRAIDAGTLDPVALTEAMLDAIAASPHGADIYARTMPGRARAEAEGAAARARAGTRRGPLDGVPISWKDLYDTAGVATESGSALLKDRVPERDAQVLQNAAAAGLVCLGKTHQTELAFSGLGVNPVTATPPNRHDPDLAPGGSSSGAATSVAFGLAAAGIGSDTGGSVRIPSAWNDLVGFKTSHGSLPMDGVVPLCARFDTIGPLCRSVEDAALLCAAMGAARATDMDGASLAGARLLILQSPALPTVDEAPQAAFDEACGKLSAAGAQIESAAVDAVSDAMKLAAIFPAEAYGTWGAAIEAAPDLMYAPVRKRFEAGKSVTGPQFVAEWQRLEALRLDFRAATAGYDAVLLPSIPILPPKVADLLASEETFAEANLKALRNTRVGNLMNLCAVTLPTGRAQCGIMAMAPAGSDARLLRLAAAMEKSL